MIELYILGIICFALIFCHHLISKKLSLSFGEFLVLTIAISSCVTAIYFTTFTTLLLLPFIGFLYLFFCNSNSIKENYKKDYLYFLGSIVFFWVIMQILYLPYKQEDRGLVAYPDFVYYFNKIQLISKTGIEDVNQSVFSNSEIAPSFYHYGDLWFYRLMSFFLKWTSLENLLLFVIMPFLASVSSQLMLNILRKYFENNLKIYLVSILPAIFVAFIEISPNLGAAGLCQNSALNHTKDTFLLCLLLLLFYYYQFSDRKWVYFTFSLSLFFINVGPAILSFYALISLVDIFKSRKIKKNYFTELLLGMVICLFVFFLYKDTFLAPKTPAIDEITLSLSVKIVRLIAYVRDFGFSILMYLPTILIIFLSLFFSIRLKDIVLPIKLMNLMLLFPIGLGLVCANFYTNVDSFQLLSNLVPSLIAILFCVLLIQIKKINLLLVSVSVILLISCYEMKNFTYLMISNINDKCEVNNQLIFSEENLKKIKQFTGNDSEFSTFISKTNRENWTNPESNMDTNFLYKIKFPFYSTMLELKDFEKLKHFKQYNQLKNVYSKTPFAKFYYNGKYTNIPDAQLDFIKKYKIRLLFTDFEYKLSSKLKKKATDSLIISQNKMKIYRF